MAKYRAVLMSEAAARRLPMHDMEDEAEARKYIDQWERDEVIPAGCLYDPEDPAEASMWLARSRREGWAVVEDRDLYVNGVRMTSDIPMIAVGADQKVTRAAADGKARVELIPMHAILGLADAFNYGALKYQEGNWELAATDPTARKRYAAALVRHGLLIIAGEVLDPESGLPHWDMAAASCGIGRETDPETRGKRFKMKEPPK